MGEQLAEEAPARRTRAPGERSRARILEQAARLATIEGLAGLSVGGLAEATGMAKSSVYALFGSKEELQLATIDAARGSFIAEVISPALRSAQPGCERLLAFCEGFLSYVERRVFPGGCFFVGVSAELAPAPAASTTGSPASSRNGVTCWRPRPAWPPGTGSSRQGAIQRSSHSSSAPCSRARTSSPSSTTTTAQ